MNNMKGVLSHSVVCVTTLFMGLLAATGMMAQGKTGTTIVFDATTSHGLFASGAGGEDINKQVFSLIRHDIAHVQIFASNNGILDNSTSLYNDAANNFLFDSALNKELTIGNGYYSRTDNGGTRSSFFVIAAPKGYRFIKYDIVIDGKNSYNRSKLSNLNYEGGIEDVVDEVIVDGNQSDQLFSNVISDDTNLLYFRFTTSSYGTNYKIAIKSIRLTYAIDQSFANQLPTSDGDTKIHSGFLDPGTFKNNGHSTGNSNKGYWAFAKDEAMTDYQYVSIFQGSSVITPEVVTVDGDKYYVAATNGDYYVEAPQKFRIVGATLNFLRRVAGDFKATPYARDNSVMEGHQLKEGDDAYTVELSNLNNDAIHFSISDLAEGQSALYNVNLKLMPLNPEVQNLSVASKFGSDKIQNATSFKSVNYVFNDGEAVTLLAPEGQSTCSVDFLNAYNEEGTLWYSGGGNENTPQGGYSNYFLVNSEADQGGVTDVLLDVTKSPRTEATQAGTNGLKFTNIEELYNTNLKDEVANGPEKLIDNPFSKEEAGYAEATLDVDGAAKTFYIYSADQPTFNIMPEGAGVKHIDYRYYTLKVACKSQKEKPAVTITPIYHETLKAQNHKNTAIASDGGTADKSLTFYGVTVKAKLAEGEGQAQGYLTSNDIVEAIKTAVADKAKEDAGFKFKEGDELRGCLYIDMSSLRRTDNDAFDYVFHLSTADNCLYFMYNGFSRENVTNTMALAADGKTFEADGNVVVYDQQPFFSPYDFNTAQYTVTYEREGTVQKEGGVKERVKNMAVVLPFDVSLDGNGKLKTASDATDNNVTYHNITSSGTLEGVGNQGQELTYGILADPATGVTTANANSPYYVTTEGDGFTYNIHGAQFRKTGTVASDNNVSFADMTRTNGTWTGHGTYAGVQPKAGKAQDALKGMWYFSQNLFWNADNLVNNDHVNIRPFRAYFTTTDKTSASQAKVVFSLNDIVTGIGSVASGNGNGLAVSAGRGSLTLTAGGATGFGVYTVAGSLVAKGALSAGESRSVALPQGVYVVNGVKVVVK